MFTLVLALLVAQAQVEAPSRALRAERVQRVGGRTGGASYAFFEAFPANGAGTTTACSTTAPTGARGETLTFTRGSSATCQRTATGGLATTGIADGDLVVLSSNVARVEYDANGVLGLLVESSRTNSILRSAELCNAAWTDVGTPTCTSDASAGPLGTATMDRITDDDAAATEGRIQSVATTSATRHTVTCFVKAGTATSAAIALTGTGSSTGDCLGTATGLSTTTSTRISCTSPAAYGGTVTAVSLGIVVGTQASDTGSILVEGCQLEINATYATSYIPTVGVAVTRAAETASFAPTWPTSASISMAATFYGPTPVSGSAATALEFNGLASILNESVGLWRWFTAGTGQSVAITSSTGGVRTYGWHDGVDRGVGWAANTATTASASAANKFGLTLFIGGSAGNRPDAILSRICVDPSPTRCR